MIFCRDLISDFFHAPLSSFRGYPGNIHKYRKKPLPSTLQNIQMWNCSNIDHFPNSKATSGPEAIATSGGTSSRKSASPPRPAVKGGGWWREVTLRCSVVRGMWWVWWGRALETRPGVDAGGVTSWVFYFFYFFCVRK